jgi:hypothetical protein
MRPFSLLLVVALVGVCLGAERKPASTPQSKEPTYESKTLSEWVALAKGKDPAVRIEAAKALGEMGAGAIPALIELLKDKDWQIRIAATGALGKIGPEAKTAIPDITALLRDEEACVRIEAAWALAKMGAEAKNEATRVLTELLRNKMAGVRGIEERFGELLTKSDFAGIDALCVDLGKKASTRITIILPNGKVVGDTEESPSRMENHKDRPEFVAALAGRTGESLRYSTTLKECRMYVAVPVRQGGKTISVLRTAVSLDANDYTLVAARALADIRPTAAKTALQALAVLLKDESACVRVAAAEALGKIGPEAKATIPVLKERLNDENERVRKAAAEALDKIKKQKR